METKSYKLNTSSFIAVITVSLLGMPLFPVWAEQSQDSSSSEQTASQAASFQDASAEEPVYSFQIFKKERDALQASLKQDSDVFGIPVLINDRTKADVLHLTKDTMAHLLDSNGDSQPDDQALTSFMAQNGYNIIVLKSSSDIDYIDDQIYPDERTAGVSSSGINIDDYLTASLALIVEARLEMLKTQTVKGDEKAQFELEDLNKAVLEVYATRFLPEPKKTEAHDDKEDAALENEDFDDKGDDNGPGWELDTSELILMTQSVLSGQTKTLLDRMVTLLNIAKSQRNEENFHKSVRGRALNIDDLGNAARFYHETPESIQEKLPLLCNWIKRNRLLVPYIDVNALRPLEEYNTNNLFSD